MKTSLPVLQGFFSHLSYTARMRLLCGLGVFLVVLMLFLIFYVHYPLVRLYENKLRGLEQNALIIDVLKKSSDMQMLLASNASGESIARLITDIEQPIKKISGNDADTEQIRISWQKIFSAWKNQQQLSVDQLVDFTKDILPVLNHTHQVYGLNLEYNLKNYLISDIMMLHLPVTLSLLSEIEAQRNNPQAQSEIKLLIESVTKEMNFIHDEIIMAFDQETSAKEKDGEIPELSLFYSYANSVSAYLEQIKNSSPDKTSVKKMFQRGWDLEALFISYFQERQKIALDTLHAREYATTFLSVLLLLAFLFMYFSRLIRSPLLAVKQGAQALADGDLTVRVPITTKDETAEITHALNKVASNWEDSIANAKRVSESLSRCAQSISDAAQNLESNAREQQNIIQDIEKHAKDISLGRHKYMDLLPKINKSIEITRQLAHRGTLSLEKMGATLQYMIEVSKQIVVSHSDIKDQVTRINDLIGSVAQLTDQSNLLSLNTAVRARRFGISGKGFAVVADRIGELADQTALATLDIEVAVHDIVAAMSKAVTDADTFSAQITMQIQDEKGVNEQLKVRIKTTQAQLESFDNINANMQDKINAFKHIEGFIGSFSQMTMSTHQSVQKLYLDAEYLSSSVRSLQELLESFKVTTKM